MKKLPAFFIVTFAIFFYLSIHAIPLFAEEEKSAADRAKELQDKMNSTAKDRAWSGLKDDIVAVPGGWEAAGKAADQLLASMPDLIRDMDAMQTMTPEEKVKYIRGALVDRVKGKSVDLVKDTVKAYMEKYAEQKIREYLFKKQIGSIVHQCVVGGQSVSNAWQNADALVKSDLDTGMRKYKTVLQGATITWDVASVWWKEGGTQAALTLEAALIKEFVQYMIPGWGYYEIALDISNALREAVLNYAFEAAYQEKLALLLPFPPQQNPAAFARWILDTDIPGYVSREWDEQIGYTGAYRKYFKTTEEGKEQTEEFGEAMKTKLIEYLQIVKADFKKKQDVQKEIEAKVAELEKKTAEADQAVRGALGTGMTEAQKYLQMINDFNDRYFGFAKKDASDFTAKKEKELAGVAAASNKSGDAIKYAPIDKGTVLSALQAAGGEMTESGEQGWNSEILHASYETYLDIRKKEIEKVQKEVGEKVLEAQKLLERIDKSYQPQLDELNRAYEATNDENERNRIRGQVEQIQEARAVASRPYWSVAQNLPAEFGKDTALLQAQESELVLEIAERARARNKSLALGMQVLRDEMDVAVREYQAEMGSFRNEIKEKLNYPDCWRNIKYVSMAPAEVQNQARFPGDFIQNLKTLEGLRQAVESDAQEAARFFQREKKALDNYFSVAQTVRNAFYSLVPKGLQQFNPNREKGFSGNIDGMYGVAQLGTFLTGPGGATIQGQSFRIPNVGFMEDLQSSRTEVMKSPVDAEEALQKIRTALAQLKPLAEADEAAQAFYAIAARISEDPYMTSCIHTPIAKEKERASEMFGKKDGKVPQNIDPEDSDGTKYLSGMKLAWEAQKDRVGALKNLKKAVVGTVVYTAINRKMEIEFQEPIDIFGSLPDRIKIFEAAAAEAKKTYEEKMNRMERYIKEQREKLGSLSQSYLLSDRPKALKEMDNLLQGWITLAGVSPSARAQKLVEDMNKLREEIAELMKKTDGEIKTAEQQTTESNERWKREEAERVRREEEERKKKEEAEEKMRERGSFNVSEGRINGVPVSDAGPGGEVRFMKNDLRQGGLEVTGRLTTADNVKALSWGETEQGPWQNVPAAQSFRFSMKPEQGKRYVPHLKITTGLNEVTLPIFPGISAILYKDADYTQLVAETLKKIADAYEQLNVSAFSECVSRDFLGNKTSLEEGVRFDFDTFNGIRLMLMINRIEKRGDQFAAEVKWNKDQTVRKTGRQQRTSGNTTMIFALEDGAMKIKNLRGDLIYATLSPEIAEASGLGQDAIEKIKKARESGTGAQPGAGSGDDTGKDDGGGGPVAMATLTTGTFTLTQYKLPHPPDFDVEGFNFRNQSKTREASPFPVQADFRRREGWVESSSGVVDLGSVGIDSVDEVPGSGYMGYVAGAQGHVFAVRLSDGTYALVETQSLADVFNTPNTSTFKFKYQRNGTRSFK